MIAISWIAYGNDFLPDSSINKEGPTARFHYYHLRDYEKHYWLMSWEQGDPKNAEKEQAIKDYLSYLGLEKKVIPVFIGLKDPVNIVEIREKLEKKMIELNLKNHELEAFISPGTPSMMVVWYMLYASGEYKLKVFQIRRPDFAEGKIEREYIQLENTFVPHTLYLKSVSDGIKTEDDYLITNSIKPVYELAGRAALTDEIPVLITGENGTGKEHLARFIHKNSQRRDKKFIAVNCSALTDSLLESRLFGYIKGAFSGAYKDTKGFFEEADGGTLFLDEIGDISPFMQQSLLRAIQEKKIIRVGATEEIKVDVRIICATNKDLQKLISEGKFREDLFYRIAGAELELPPLRMRGLDEIREYLNFYIPRCKPKGQNIIKLSEQVIEILLNYSFPGNIRELINLIYKLYLLQKEVIEPDDLPARVIENKARVGSWKLEDVEREHIVRAMQYFEGNKTKVAEALDIAHGTLYNKIKKYGIESNN